MQQALLVHRLLIPIWSLPLHWRLVYRQCSIKTRFSINRAIIGYLKLCKLCISFVNGEIERCRMAKLLLADQLSVEQQEGKRLRRFNTRDRFNDTIPASCVFLKPITATFVKPSSQMLTQSIYSNSNNLNLKVSD